MTSFFRFLRATPSAEWVSVWAATAFALLLLLLMALPAAAQSLVVDPPASFPSELTFTVDIVLESGGLEVKGVETMITFDPGFLHLDEVTPGPWLTGTGQAYFFFDYTDLVDQGMIHFASSVLDGTNNQSAVLATCHFTATTYGSSNLVFQEVDVRDGSNVPLTFANSMEDMITVDQAVHIQPETFGALKAIYR